MRSILCSILKLVCNLLGCSPASLQLSFIAGNIRISGVELMSRMNNEQTIDVSVSPRTGSGNPASLDGPASFTVDPAEAGSFEQLSDTSARFTPASGFTGAAQVVVTADADMDPGEERHLTASGALEILAPEAENLEVTFGEPQNTPPPA
ncbi:MAG TPA: hypothetical protein VFR60_11175 [Sphingomicrobium sp.]|nr:hypothetical protein [Sphingomicrobium sp.]